MRKAVIGLGFFLFSLPLLAFAGSQSYTSPGTYTFTVPAYGTLSVSVYGAGGGGGGGSVTSTTYTGGTGGSGGYSEFSSLVGYGGSGGTGGNTSGPGSTGGVGSATGGSSNVPGGGAGGGAGGAGSGIYNFLPVATGGAGGAGGLASITYSSGSLTPGANITVVVGSGGTGGAAAPTGPVTGYYPGNGGTGNNGEVNITWTSIPAPTCSVSISPNPSAYSYTGTPVTVSWSSGNASQVFINNIGWVNPSGSTQVASLANTDYSCYGYNASYGDGPTYSAALTVTPPSSPTATIIASPASITTGQSTNITATFSASSGDALTADNIDSPPGTGLGADTSPGSKSITFSSATPGTYTFYARATTDYYTSWATYNTVDVTVTADPQCTISLNPTSIVKGGTSTLSYSSSNATSFSINNVGSKTPNTSGQITVSPTQSTDYTGTVKYGSTTVQCTAAGTTPAGTLTVTCNQSWSCTGQTIVQTNTDCSTTNLATCVAPSFCQTGANSCQYPAISFNPSGNLTGHLQLIPSIVQPSKTTQVSWNVSNAQSCTVTGTNGDSWTGLTSSGGGNTSSPITMSTTYKLSCIAYGTNPNVNESQTVTITPVYQER